MKRIPIFGFFVVVALVIALVIGIVVFRRTPALDYGAACNLAEGVTATVEGYLFPNNVTYSPTSARQAQWCEGQACYLTLSSRPMNAGQQLEIKMPIKDDDSRIWVGTHGEMYLPFTLPIKNGDACLNANTRFRLTGQMSTAAVGGCLLDKVEEITVIENPQTRCGP